MRSRKVAYYNLPRRIGVIEITPRTVWSTLPSDRIPSGNSEGMMDQVFHRHRRQRARQTGYAACQSRH